MPTLDEMVGHPGLDGRPTILKLVGRAATCGLASYAASLAFVALAALFRHDLARDVPAIRAMCFAAASATGPLRWLGASLLPGFGLAYSLSAYVRRGGEIPIQPNARDVIAAYVALPVAMLAWRSASPHHDPLYATLAVALSATVAWRAGLAATHLLPDPLFARRGDYARKVRGVDPVLGEDCAGPDGFNWEVLRRRVLRMNPHLRRTPKRVARLDAPTTNDRATSLPATAEGTKPAQKPAAAEEPRIVEYGGRFFIATETLRPPSPLP
ncbi:MAG TPA: hypothetical protein VHT53_06090 [Candidatus Elarobacter sp.]|nr:hypothetical protein [Candidatus Elarobacter sp.]